MASTCRLSRSAPSTAEAFDASVRKKWYGYGLLAAVAATFVLLWVAVGDSAGAFLSLLVLSLGIALIVAVLGYLISNGPSWIRRLRGVSRDEHLRNLEASGHAVREQYRTVDALSFEDLNTGSLVHVIDIGAGRLLCLVGQQYYDFEPVDDDPEVNQPRLFPSREFSLLRQVESNAVLALFPGTVVVEPTVREPVSRFEKLFELGIRLEDGEIVTGVSLGEVKRAIRPAS